MGRLTFVAALAITVAGCGGGGSAPPRLVDGNRPAELPAALADLDDAVMTRTNVRAASDVDEARLRACGGVPGEASAEIVERIGVHGSSFTYLGPGSSLNGCSAIPDPIDDPDMPFGGLWCSVSVGFLTNGELNDPRLGLCTDDDGELTAFVWVEPSSDATWVVVSDAGAREVYEVVASLPVRVTTTGNVDPAGKASFDIEEYARDGTKLREYVLDAVVAG